MSKQKMVFAEHRSNGFVVDLVREGLGFKFDDDNAEIIEGMDSTKKGKSISRTSKRGTKENDIAVEKYSQNEKKLCNALIEYLFSLNKQKSEQDEREIEFFEGLVREFLGYFSQYKSYIQTLGAGQRQLDFITAAVFFAPFLAHAIASLGSIRLELLPENERAKAQQVIEPFIVDRILPNSSKSALQKVFELIGLSKDNIAKSLLSSEDLQNLKEAPKIKHAILEAPNKNVSNWSKGKEKPSLYNIKRIAKLGKTPQECRKIEILLKIARLSQSLYDKAKGYFGEDLANLLVEHFRLVSVVSIYEMSAIQGMGRLDALECTVNFLADKLPKTVFTLLHNYLEWYYSNNFFNFSLEKIRAKGKYDKELSGAESEYFKHLTNLVDFFTRIDEQKFFAHINLFLPVRHFAPQNFSELGIKDWQGYFNERIEAFMSPNKDEVELPSEENLQKALNKDFMDYADAVGKLFALTYPKWEKHADDEAKFNSLLSEIESKYDTSEDPYVCFLKARFYAQKLELEKANECYLNALKFGKNVLGHSVRDAIKEGLIVSAQLTLKDSVDLKQARSDFTKFYKEAFFLQLIGTQPDENRYSRHFLRDEQKKFHIYFRQLFPSAEQNSQILDKKQTKIRKRLADDKGRYINPNNSFATIKEFKDIKLDLENPNKFIDKPYPHPITQLMHFCSMGDLESIKRLLEAGADVNILKPSDDGSVLHCLINDFGEPPLHIPQEQIELAKLLIPKCTPQTLNARLVKKRQTILSHCISRGLVELVELLMDCGADFSSAWCSMDDLTPLYWCISQIAQARGHSPQNSTQLLEMCKTLNKEQIMAMMKTQSNATFDDEYFVEFERRKQDIMQNPKLVSEFLSAVNSARKENLANYYKIFDLLVERLDESGINAIMKNGFTALIFAAELNEANLVKKLLARGADKTIRLASGESAYDYSQMNYNLELMIKLRL